MGPRSPSKSLCTTFMGEFLEKCINIYIYIYIYTKSGTNKDAPFQPLPALGVGLPATDPISNGR